MSKKTQGSAKGKGRGKTSNTGPSMRTRSQVQGKNTPGQEDVANSGESEAGEVANDDSIYFPTRPWNTPGLPRAGPSRPNQPPAGEGGTSEIVGGPPVEDLGSDRAADDLNEHHAAENHSALPSGSEDSQLESGGGGSFIGNYCLADLRREIMFIRQEMFRVTPSQWERARQEFHVRLATLEGQIQEGACSHIDELIAGGQHTRAQVVQKTLDKLQDLLVESQEFANNDVVAFAKQSELTHSADSHQRENAQNLPRATPRQGLTPLEEALGYPKEAGIVQRPGNSDRAAQGSSSQRLRDPRGIDTNTGGGSRGREELNPRKNVSQSSRYSVEPSRSGNQGRGSQGYLPSRENAGNNMNFSGNLRGNRDGYGSTGPC